MTDPDVGRQDVPGPEVEYEDTDESCDDDLPVVSKEDKGSESGIQRVVEEVPDLGGREVTVEKEVGSTDKEHQDFERYCEEVTVYPNEVSRDLPQTEKEVGEEDRDPDDDKNDVSEVKDQGDPIPRDPE